jgi:hypothetical protein
MYCYHQSSFIIFQYSIGFISVLLWQHIAVTMATIFYMKKHTTLNANFLTSKPCPGELAIYVHRGRLIFYPNCDGMHETLQDLELCQGQSSRIFLRFFAKHAVLYKWCPVMGGDMLLNVTLRKQCHCDIVPSG